MRRVALLSFLVVLALWPGSAGAAPTPSPSVVVVKVDGSIDRVQARYLEDSIARAEEDGDTVVIQLDTAGTLDQPAVELAQRIFEATVPVVVWVGPAPAKAQGAGLLFMCASSLAAVAPGVGIGPLEPLDLVDARAAEAPPIRTVEEMATSWATDRGKPTPISFPERPIPAQAALDGNIAQVSADSVPGLLAAIDGRTVTTATGEVTLHTKIAESPSETPTDVRFTSLGPVDRVLHAMASPAAIYVLLVLGLAAAAFEITQPGFGFAGFAGAAMVALAAYGLFVVPFSWLGLALSLGGTALMVADVVLRRLGVLTVLGLLAFAAGSFMLFRGVDRQIQISPWLIVLATAAALLYYGFALTVAIQSRERITSTQKGLVGLVGEARGALDPEGPVFVKGTLWRGRSAEGTIAAGTRIRVRGVDGLILRVAPEPEEPGPSGAEPA